jgi:hypothetical protein
MALGTWYNKQEVPVWPSIAPVPQAFIAACSSAIPSAGVQRIVFEYVFEDHVPKCRAKPDQFLTTFIPRGGKDHYLWNKRAPNWLLLEYLITPDLRNYLAASKGTNHLGSLGWQFEEIRLKQAGYVDIWNQSEWDNHVELPWHQSYQIGSTGSLTMTSQQDNNYLRDVYRASVRARLVVDRIWSSNKPACSHCGIFPLFPLWQDYCSACAVNLRDRTK